ncbi:MAG: CoA-binding protein [Betaproteobacteria bacterium]|jgi:predicted CoA-binding protein
MNDYIRQVLISAHTIAIVGLSDKPNRPSYQVAQYLQDHGYRIVPVNPLANEILGEKSYPKLSDIPFKVDLVDVFRRPEECLQVAQEAIEIEAQALWLQLGISNEDAKDLALKHHIHFIENMCIKIEHTHL